MTAPPRRRRIIVAAAAALLVSGGAYGVLAGTAAGRRLLPAWARPPGGAIPGSAPLTARVVPEGVRVKVEVLNATDTRGLARSAAFFLRDAGFDVVYFGNASERRDSTVVRDRTGHPDWAGLARQAMAPAVVEVAPDSTRLVDLSVVVGTLWRPPPDPFRP